MSRSVLVPLDGSPLAEHALPWGAELARRGNAELRIVRVHLPPVSVAAEGFVALYPVVEDATLREAEEEYLRGALARVKAADPELAVTARVVELDADGDVPDTLARYAAGAGAEWVVMTTHGRGPFTRFWLGSTADEFVRHSPAPVLLLRPHEGTPADLAHRPQVRHVLIPLDGSELGERVVPPAARLGRLFAADYTLLMVLEHGPRAESVPALEPIATPLPGAWNPQPAVEHAKGYLDRVALDVKEGGAAVHSHVETHGSAAAAILHFAQTHPDTVTALATHGRRGLTRLLLGSTADKVIRAAAGPVLVYRPPAKGKAAGPAESAP